MCEKPLGKRLNSGDCTTAMPSRTLRCMSSGLVGASSVNSACRRKSNSENSSWRTMPMPDWKFLAASNFCSRSSGSGSPVSWWLAIRARDSGFQHQFSRNWLGNSTASQATPLMPDTSITSTCVRSEEHTSELQSRPHLVCRLLLEKKKNKHYHTCARYDLNVQDASIGHN